MTKILSITQAGKSCGLTRAAIYVAVRLKKLKATKILCQRRRKKVVRWEIKEDDLLEYNTNKYNRSLTKNKDGSLKFDNEAGYYSPKQLAKLSDISVQRIYYWLRMGYLKYTKKGCSFIVHIDDYNTFTSQEKL